MSQTHEVSVGEHVVTKRYRDWARGEHLREWNALRAISAAAPGLVPRPLEFLPGPAIAISRVPGVPLGGTLSAEQRDGLEVALRELWSIPPGGLEPMELHAFVRRVRAAISVRDGADHVGRGSAGVVDSDGGRIVSPASAGGLVGSGCAGVVGEAQVAALEWLAGSEVDELVEVVEPVVGHGDANLANYLWDGRRVRIVDFEDAGRSDLAIELANLIEHIASRATDWTGFAERFAVDVERLWTARCLFAIFWLTLLRPGGPSANRNPPGTAELQARRVLALIRRESVQMDMR
ncbi:phosphotransferase family enzyme [Kribbella sp. VKM Ac-2527]|uniref:Phosphotransferase family enzyme n=1 Tax=Kribbella caucasensis TaxID=2512215 RepID=A0A4R6J5M7_9ACTN|nr:phosphotransferase [Kribbella sp. VKM Ac-2527]TDO30730.1 phosphotransferase family enzyme [Kribbella sp. VKM Ac-2527]